MEAREAPKFSELIMPVLEILKEHDGLASNEAIISCLKEKGYPSGGFQPGTRNRTQLEYRTAWAKTYLKNFGAVTNPRRAQWQITEKGRTITEKDVSNIVSSVVRTAQQNSRKKPEQRTKAVQNRGIQHGVDPIDQARIIIGLREKGILTQTAANKALLAIIGG